MQTEIERKDYYLKRNFYKEYSSLGTPYIAEYCNILDSDNVIIYGHHITNNKMFGELENYKNKEFYENHKIINFNTIYGEINYEIISVFKTIVYEENTFKYYDFVKANSKDEYDSFINKCEELSLYETEKTAKVAQRVAQATKVAIKATIKAIQLAIKIAIMIIKLIIQAVQALVALIIAGGWISVIVIIVIALIALICTSIYGIFLSNENEVGSTTMSSIVRKINTDFTSRITQIQNNTPHDDYEINSNRASWKDVLSVYAVEVSNGEEQTEVVTLNEDKINKLKEIFWEMNTINSRTEEIERDIEIYNDDGTTKIVKTKEKFYILI